MFLFPRWDMLVPSRVVFVFHRMSVAWCCPFISLQLWLTLIFLELCQDKKEKKGKKKDKKAPIWKNKCFQKGMPHSKKESWQQKSRCFFSCTPDLCVLAKPMEAKKEKKKNKKKKKVGPKQTMFGKYCSNKCQPVCMVFFNGPLTSQEKKRKSPSYSDYSDSRNSLSRSRSRSCLALQWCWMVVAKAYSYSISCYLFYIIILYHTVVYFTMVYNIPFYTSYIISYCMMFVDVGSYCIVDIVVYDSISGNLSCRMISYHVKSYHITLDWATLQKDCIILWYHESIHMYTVYCLLCRIRWHYVTMLYMLRVA